MAREFESFSVEIAGTNLIEAGAGTGKTYSIASLFVRSIIEKNLLPSNILVLTYTEAATSELRKRLRKRLYESIDVLKGATTTDPFLIELTKRYDTETIIHLEKALYSFDDAMISTIHGFCQQLLKEYSLEFEVEADFEIIPDESMLIQDTIDKYWREFFTAKKTDSYHEAVRNFLANLEIYPEKIRSQIQPIIDKPYAEIVPNLKGIDEYQEELDHLLASFKRLSNVFHQDYEDLIQIAKSGTLKGNLYKNPLQFISEIKSWIDSSNALDVPYSNLHKMGSYLPTKGIKKDADISSLPIFECVDEYLESYQHLRTIEVAFYKEAANFVQTHFYKEKSRRGVLGYNDLLFKVFNILKDKTYLGDTIRKKFPVALIDEFQDTDPIQYGIFEELFVNKSFNALFLIGDPKQAIYRFRGADLNTYLKVKASIKEDHVFTLSTNFRSSEALINSVNAFFKYKEHPFIKPNLPFKDASYPTTSNSDLSLSVNEQTLDPIQWKYFEKGKKLVDNVNEEIAGSIASEIIELITNNSTIDGKTISTKDIAILTSTHSQAAQIQDVLSSRGLQSVITGKESIYKSKEAGEIYLILKSLAEVENDRLIRAALSTEILGYKSEDIIQLLDNEQGWNQILTLFSELSDTWIDHGFSRLITQLSKQFSIELTLSKLDNAERRLTNFYHVSELLTRASLEEQLSVHGLLKFFKNKRTNSKNIVSDEEIVRLESDSNLIQILTVHASKGLEFPIVFCPFLWSFKPKSIQRAESFDFSNDGTTYIHLGSNSGNREEHIAIRNDELNEESIRLLYVALTRAKSCCYVYVEESWKNNSALTYLLADNPTFYTQLDSANLPIKRTPIFDSKILYSSSTRSEFFEGEIRKFERRDLNKHPILASFSSLSNPQHANVSLDQFGYDYDDFQGEGERLFTHSKDRFTLPKGKKTGTLLHSIFENIDFQDLENHSTVIRSLLSSFSFEESWFTCVSNMVEQTLSQNLEHICSLNAISNSRRLIEMEFHFPILGINGEKVLSIIRGKKSTSLNELNGYMKGFIDLIFEWEGKYYILDYKSNHLGNNQTDYETVSLKNEIIHANYDLQYHIYIVALTRYMKQRLSDFDYQKHFGGVFYLFLRGVDPTIPNSGVYYDLPKESVITELDNYFKGHQ